MADIRPLDNDTIVFIRASSNSIHAAIRVYDSFISRYKNADIWFADRVNIKDEKSRAKKILGLMSAIMQNKSYADEQMKDIKERINALLHNLSIIHKEAQKDKTDNEGLASFFKQRNIDLDKIIKDLKSLDSKGSSSSSEVTKPFEYSPGQTLAMKAAYLSGMTPLGAALKSVFAIGQHISQTRSEFTQAKANFKKSKFGQGFLDTFSGQKPSSDSSDSSTSAISGGSVPTQTISDLSAGDGSRYGAFKRKGKWYESHRDTSGQFTKTAQIDPIQAALIKFFSTSAFHVKWTKDLLEAVQNGGMGGMGGSSTEGGSKSSKSAGGLFEKVVGSLFSKATTAAMGVLGNFIGKGVGLLSKYVGPAAAITGAGLVGWGAGRWVGENVKVGGKSVDKHVQDWASNNLFDSENKKADYLNLQSQITDPKMRKKIELQRSGLSPQDAYKVVYGSKVTSSPSIKHVATQSQPITSGVDEQGFHYTQKTTIETKAEKDAQLRALKEQQNKDKEYTAAVKQYFPQGTAGMSAVAVSKKVHEFKADQLRDEISDAKAGIVDSTGRTQKSLSEVPLDQTQAQLQKELKEALDQLNKQTADMHQTIKDSNKTASTPKPSGYDANNTRNPVLSSIGAGQLDVG